MIDTIVFFLSKRWFKLPLLLAVVSLLGFGFQFRSWDFKEIIPVVSLDADDSIRFLPSLERELQKAGIRIVAGQEKRIANLVLSGEEQSQRAYSFTSEGYMFEYELMLKVNLRVSSSDQTIMLDRDISIRRIGSIDRDSLVGTSEQRSLILQQMRMDIVQRILQTLGALVRDNTATQEL